ncbi:MAG: chemotaxis response regulator protein-glutamate methylesterase [Pirellulales bacterium]
METGNTRILVVDDSAVMRELMCQTIENADRMEVAGTAYDGQNALSQIEELSPDLVTLDIMMPRMDGLQTLDAILKRDPIPVIMVSAMATRAADITLDALDRGAMDYIAKPENLAAAQGEFQEELLRKIRASSGIDIHRILEIRAKRRQKRASRAVKKSPAPTAAPPLAFQDKCIAIGISTGGPPALAAMFATLQPPMPPIVIVQHMPGHFTGSFASRLDSLSELSVKEAQTGDRLQPNHVLLAPGGVHLELQRRGNSAQVIILDEEPVSGHKPSVDVMMKSAAQIFGNRCLGVIMTGMGRDGSDGCRDIRKCGGYVLGQDQETSDVYGMNKIAMTEGNVDQQFSLDHAVGTITKQVRRLWRVIPNKQLAGLR